MSQNNESPVFPTPLNFRHLDGFLEVPQKIHSYFEDNSYQCLLKSSPLPLNKSEKESANLCFIQKNYDDPEAYKIEATRSGITVFTSTPRGGLFALHSLRQILDSHKKELPCFEINDRPFLKRRGFMLDISRCKVPTMDSIFELIDLLSLLRFNELQLYIEHTFAFRDHEKVWKNFSPLTGSEIQRIDHYCRDRFIELVPNLNSFGHFERWLRHEPYRSLAECPDGFKREEPFMVRDHGSVLKPNLDSLKFVDSLYNEYLPNFSSSKFNVGLDEPWELGEGWSRSRVEKIGKQNVYLEHLKGILSLVEKHGKSMEFWADVLFENPKSASQLPATASPIIWGYEADHPFDQQAACISACGLNYSIAPGTATWRSFSGRWNTARENLSSASQNAKKHNADGILLTTWGDCGNHQPWSTFYPPLFLGAQLFWNGLNVDDDKIGSFIDREVFGHSTCGLGKSFIDLAKLDQVMDFDLPNNSLPWFALFSAQPEKLSQHLSEKTNLANIQNGLAWLLELNRKSFSFPKATPADIAEQEWRLGIELSMIGVEHAISVIGSTGAPLIDAIRNAELIKRFKDVWLLRAREGGLHEAVDLLEEAQQKTA